MTDEGGPGIPAPWHLTGQAYVLLYRFPRPFLARAGRLPPSLRFQGGLGSVVLADYTRSPAGPYRELLFSPGRFTLGGGSAYSVTRIFVSTAASMENGRANWGLPKEQACFAWREEAGRTRVTVTVGGDRVMEIGLAAGWLRFWAGTLLWPVPLVQVREGKTFLTRLRGRGWLRPAGVPELAVDGRFFPDVSRLKPLAVFRVDDLRLALPAATGRA